MLPSRNKNKMKTNSLRRVITCHDYPEAVYKSKHVFSRLLTILQSWRPRVEVEVLKQRSRKGKAKIKHIRREICRDTEISIDKG